MIINSESKYAVIVIAYNRPFETNRLVESICRSRFNDEKVDLIIDVDKGPKQDEIVKTMKDVKWKHGKYEIIVRSKRMGLRPHILECGNYTQKYDAIIVLEDDLIVSPAFFEFAIAAVNQYDDNRKVSQISLYTYAVNEFEARPFYPAKSNSDVFAMQIAQSWGECWSRRMWNDFRESEFYSKNEFNLNPKLHNRVNSWGKNSWKKNYSNYLVTNDLFVIYPYDSYTTNYSEPGEHCKRSVSDYQVSMQYDRVNYRFLPLDECIRYDSFFERIVDCNDCHFSPLCMDLYGSKNEYGSNRYLATTKRLQYQVVKEYGLIRKPCEYNVIFQESGEGIFLYDLYKPCLNVPKNNDDILINYDYGCLSWKNSLKHGFSGLINSVNKRLKIAK